MRRTLPLFVIGFMLLFARIVLASSDLLAAATQAAVRYLGVDFAERITLSEVDITYAGDWAFGFLVVRPQPGVDDTPGLMLFIARPEAGNWQIALEPTALFQEWLLQSPAGLINPAARQALLAQRRSRPQASGDGTSQLSFPYAKGQSILVNGPHSVDDNLRAAIDMISTTTATVVAAREGVVYRSPTCPNFVRIDHADGWSTGYYHLINEVVVNGQSVTRGQALGNQGNETGCGGVSTEPHVHFSLYRDGTPYSLHGVHIGGWMIEAGSREYEGCIIRVSDGLRNCNSSSFTNTGLIGSGSVDRLPVWIFNHIRWTENSAASFLGYETMNGTPYWNVMAADPQLVSPVLAGFAATSYTAVFVRFATQNDDCGQLYFRRRGDTGFDDSRKVDFTPTPDGVMHNYLVDMRANANWNGTIVQLRLDPACQPDVNPANRKVSVERIDLAKTISSNLNVIRNPSFSDFSEWNYQSLYYSLDNGKFTIRRAYDLSAWSAVYQDFNTVLPGLAPLYITIQLGNDAAATRDVQVMVHDFDNLTKPITCVFKLPPNSPLKQYQMAGLPSSVWRNPRFEISVMTWPHLANDVWIDNVSVKYRPDIQINTTTCEGIVETPVLLSPANGAQINTQFPLLTWSTDTNVDHYELQLGTTNPPPTVSAAIITASYTPGALAYNVPYYWRVRAVNGSRKVSGWSETRTFTVASLASAAPERNYQSGLKISLTWNQVMWATNYRIQIARDASFTDLLKTDTLPASAGAYSWTAPSGGRYYWRLQARNASGTWGGWNTDSFTAGAP